MLDKLAKLKLKPYSINKFSKWMISDDDPLWKRPKLDTIVNDFYVDCFEIWRNNLICRTFYICQIWHQKQKETRMFEVKRKLSGCDKQLTRRLYASMSGGIKCWIHDYSSFYFFNENTDKWKKHPINTFKLDFYKSAYGGYQLVPNVKYYSLNSEAEILVMLDKTDYKYSGFEYNQFAYSELFEYLAMYEKHPAVEMISKMGLGYLLDDDLRLFRWSKKGLDILGIEKKDIKILDELRINLRDYRKYRDYIHKLKITSITEYNALIQLLAVSDLKYPNINVSRYSLDYFINQKRSMYIIKDYYRFCEVLALSMNSKNKFPDDIKKAHDELMNKIDVVNSNKKTKKIQQRVTEQLYKLRFADDKFVITPANSTSDLIIESRKLNHCVKTYADRYANGGTNIFLVRTRKDVNTPFYTLELSNDKKIVQLRGNHNKLPTNEVIEFVSEWAKKFKITGDMLIT